MSQGKVEVTAFDVVVLVENKAPPRWLESNLAPREYLKIHHEYISRMEIARYQVSYQAGMLFNSRLHKTEKPVLWMATTGDRWSWKIIMATDSSLLPTAPLKLEVEEEDEDEDDGDEDDGTEDAVEPGSDADAEGGESEGDEYDIPVIFARNARPHTPEGRGETIVMPPALQPTNKYV